MYIRIFECGCRHDAEKSSQKMVSTNHQDSQKKWSSTWKCVEHNAFMVDGEFKCDTCWLELHTTKTPGSKRDCPTCLSKKWKKREAPKTIKFHRVYKCGCRHPTNSNRARRRTGPHYYFYACRIHNEKEDHVEYECLECKTMVSVPKWKVQDHTLYCQSCRAELDAREGVDSKVLHGITTKSDCHHRRACLDKAAKMDKYINCQDCSLYQRDPALSIEAYSGYFSGAGMNEAARDFNIPNNGRL